MIDKNILREIVLCADISGKDYVLEIGPGQGVLSAEILKAGCASLYSIEIDETLSPWLTPLREKWNNFSVNFADAMKFDYSSLAPFPNKVVANIPYNITTPLIHTLIPFAERGLRNFILTVQLEAAQRLMARADTKERYPLGITLEAMGSVKILRHISRNCFRPVPNVDSCVIEIKLEKNFELGSSEAWNKFLHQGFKQRRKMLVNNLNGLYGLDTSIWVEILSNSDINPKIRAEDLEWHEWKEIFEIANALL